MTKMTNTPAGVPDLKQSEVEGAKKDGAIDYIKDGAKAAMAADTGTTGDADKAAEQANLRVAEDYPTTQIAPLLDLSVDDLVRRMKPHADDAIDFEAQKALLALERAGPNRTPYVQALCKAIGVKSPYEVTSAGPSTTNDVTSVTAL